MKKYLDVCVRMRYFYEDNSVSGFADYNVDLPCLIRELWCPLIDIPTGIITNWIIGVKAKIYTKVRDEGVYTILSEDKYKLKELVGYVPEIMCPGGQGYGDYIIMNIDENGKIENWNPELIW